MLTGQIGSGKSETLVSFCLAIAMLHPPEALQMILGDFKGETAMMKLADIPHCQGVVSNLAESAARLARRMKRAAHMPLRNHANSAPFGKLIASAPKEKREPPL